MSRIDLLKPLCYEYRGVFDIHVCYHAPDDAVYSATDFDGNYLNLTTLELEITDRRSCYTSSIEDLLLQVDLFINKTGIDNLHK